MKKIIILIIVILSLSKGEGQSKLYLRGDSIYLQKEGGNAEVIISTAPELQRDFCTIPATAALFLRRRFRY